MASKPRLDFKFAPIDTEILNHPRVLEACADGDVTPFAIWTWTVIYVTRYRTNGRVTRAVINSALGGGDHSDAVDKLVRVGLFVDLGDGSIEIWNYAKKAPKLTDDGRTPGAVRQARHRAKKQAKPANDDASHPSPASVTEGVTRYVTPSTLSPLKSSSDLKSRSEDPPQSPRVDEGSVVLDLPLAQDARDKFASLTHSRPLQTPIDVVWGNFCDHFAGQSFGSRAGVIGRWGTWIRRQFSFDDRERERARAAPRGPGGGPRGDRQGLGDWRPPRTGTDDPFGSDT